MKKIIGLLLLQLISITIFCQVTYQLRFPTKFNQTTTQMIITKDSGTLMAGNAPDSIKTTKICFAKIRSGGEFVWSEFYGIRGKILETQSLIKTHDNGFIACLISTDSLTQQQDIIIFKTDSLGNISWQKKSHTIEQTSSRKSGRLAESQDGGFYYLQENYVYVTGKDDRHYALYKFDSTGIIVWENQFTVKSESDYGSFVTNITETAGGGVALALNTISCDYECNEIFFMTFKPGGRPDEKFNLNNALYSYATPLQLLTGNTNGDIDFILEGDFFSPRSTHYTYCSLKPPTGKAKTYQVSRSIFNLQRLFYKKSIDDFKGKTLDKFPGYNSEGYAFTNIYGFDDKWNLLNGSVKEFSNGTRDNILLEKYDRLGRICPNYALPVLDDSVAIDSLTFVKSSFHLSQTQNIAIQEINELTATVGNMPATVCSGKANVISNADNLLTAKQLVSSISINPNPANDIIYISGLSKTNASTILVIDLQGRLLKQIVTHSTTCQLIISSMAKGVYLLQIQDGNNTSTQKFIKR